MADGALAEGGEELKKRRSRLPLQGEEGAAAGSEYQRVRGAIGGMDGSGMGIRPGAHRRDRDRRAAGMGHGDGRAKCN